MITRASALFDCNPGDRAQIDDLRAQVLVSLCQSKLSVEDIALALNCSEPVIRTLLARPYRHLIPSDEMNRLHPNGPIDIDLAAPVASSVVINSDDLDSAEGRHRLRAQQVHLLATEVRLWLSTFEMTDKERQLVIKRAGFILDQAEFAWTGGYVFDSHNVFLELLGIWGPKRFLTGDRDFKTLVARWLASWIHFWIVSPAIWNRALDLEFIDFGPKAHAA